MLMDILMLDLEGTVVTSLPGPGMEHSDDYHIRPYTKEFLEECAVLFDEIYLNTSVKEKGISPVMKKIGFKDYKIWAWYDMGRSKAAGYNKLKGNRIVQVDDNLDEGVVSILENMGGKYIKISGYYIDNKDDKCLMDVLDEIKRFLAAK